MDSPMIWILFFQQMGRAGRDGDFSHELILFKVHKGMLKKIDTE